MWKKEKGGSNKGEDKKSFVQQKSLYKFRVVFFEYRLESFN